MNKHDQFKPSKTHKDITAEHTRNNVIYRTIANYDGKTLMETIIPRVGCPHGSKQEITPDQWVKYQTGLRLINTILYFN